MRVSIEGFRCHANTQFDVESPITAFCGLNGTGKSTILQLLATSYRDPAGPWNIASFFSINAIDQRPFTPQARVNFRFTGLNPSYTSSRTISRSNSGRGWNGLRTRKVRSVFLAGVGCYTPLHEQPSYVYRARHFQIAQSTQVTDRIKRWVETILGSAYDVVEDHSLTAHSRRGNHLASVTRGTARYAEPNMGFGEARMIHIVRALEALPEKSLIILEEPETSLHPSAQHQFGRFLVDVAIERRHQIFVSTHSEYLLAALPDASRLYLKRDVQGVTVIPGLSASQANSLMTDGNRAAVTILVEDTLAQAIVTEIIRDTDEDFLRTARIAVGGDKDILKKTMRGLQQTGLNVIAVGDGDIQAVPAESLFKLPGTRPPEHAVFDSPSFAAWLQRRYRVAIADFTTQLRDVNHHGWFQRLADHVRVNKEALVTESARAYVDGLSIAEKSALVDSLRSAVRT